MADDYPPDELEARRIRNAINKAAELMLTMAPPPGSVVGPIRILTDGGNFKERQKARRLQDHFNWLVATGRATAAELVAWYNGRTSR